MLAHLASRELQLNKLGKGPLGNATYQFQASNPRSSEAEDFFNIFLCISIARTLDPWLEAILDLHLNKLVRGELGNVTYQISNNWS